MKSAFDEIMAGVDDAIAIANGEADPSTYRVRVPPVLDVAAIRQRTKLSRVRFAERYGFSPGAVRDGEQKRQFPDPAARTLLLIIDREPEADGRALQLT